MKKLKASDYEEVKNWVHRNARPLDLALWQYFFENGSREEVLSALSFYQNSDGGFGNLIDPDNWNPASSPYNTHIVIKMLRQIEFLDMTHPLYQGIFRYLWNTEYKADYGWFFTIPSNDNYPRACWWNYDAEVNTYQSIGTTASLCGFILRFGDKGSKLYELALTYTRFLIDKLHTSEKLGDMGVAGYCELLEDMEVSNLIDSFDYTYLKDRVQVLVRDKVCSEKDNFMANPLEFVLSPESRYYKENKEEVHSALDEIIDQRPKGGVWDIPWQWYTGDKFIKEFAVSELWWKSMKAIEKLLQLKAFGRLAE